MRAVLFDLDGVLIDSEGVYTDFWAEIDRRFPTGADDFAHLIKGTTLPDILSTYFPDAAVREEVCGLLRRQEDAMEYRPFPGAVELLRSLRRAGIATAIVTSSNLRKMRRLFEQRPEFVELTDALVTDEDVTRSKPDPQGYLTAARRLGVDPAECAVVEDSLAGLRAGRAAGAYVVALTTTNPHDAVAPLADAVLPAVRHLENLLLHD